MRKSNELLHAEAIQQMDVFAVIFKKGICVITH
jgi:hypothetical protein